MISATAPIAHYDICDSDQIYNGTYQYSLPQAVLESYLSGQAFDHQSKYTGEELERLKEDIREIYGNILSADPEQKPLAVMTAGAPGAGKTIKLRQDLEEKSAQEKRNYAYICPDDVCLKSQTRTYLSEIANGDESFASRKQAYTKWRPGSNAATHLILGDLIQKKYAFYFGTTSTGPVTHKFFDFLKQQGYQIRLIHVSAPDDVRWGSIQERDRTFVQTTEQDVAQKGLLLPQRINDTFLKYADQIEFYYRSGVKENAVLAAIWTRNQEESKRLGTLKVQDRPRYEEIKRLHNEMIGKLEMPGLSWESTVDNVSTVVFPSIEERVATPYFSGKES